MLAHELVHVIQQTGDRSTLKSGTDAEAEVEAEKLSLPSNDSSEPVGLMRPIGPQGFPGEGAIKSAGGAINDTAGDVAGGIKDGATAVGNKINDAADWTEEQLENGVEWMINQVAPGLIDFLRDPIGKAKELLWEAADTVIAGLLDTLKVVDIATWLQEKLTSSLSFAETFDGSMGEDALDTLGTILESAMDFIGGYGVSFLEMLQEKIDDIRGPLEDAWARIGKPVADFLGEAGGAAWSAISGVISWVWGLFSDVLGKVGDAGSWSMDQFGINWGGGENNGETDAKNWFMEKLASAWNAVKELIKPLLNPIVAIYEALKELWEMEEVQAVVNSMQGFWNQAKTMVDKWSADDMMVQFREMLQETVLPPVMAFLDGFGELVTGALNWLGEKVALFVAPIILLVEKVVGHEKLTKVSAIAARLVLQLGLFAAWALKGFPNVIGIFQSGLDKLKGVLQTVVDFLIDFAFAVINPIVGIPGFLLGTLWQAIPDRFKPPILTFVVNLLKTFVMAFGVLGGPLTLVLSDAIVGFLDVILESSDELKIAASNRIADLLVGSAEFTVGFFLGLLRGIWQAFSDPFIMLYDLIKALYRVASFMVEWLDSLGPNGGDSDVTMRRVDVDQSTAAAPDQAAVVNDAVAQAEATAESGGGLFSKKRNFVPAPGVDQDALGTHGEAGAEEEPELTLEQRLADSDGDAQSAIIREIYGPSAETEEGLRAGKTSGETKEQEVSESETQASGPESASEDGLSSLLGEAWGAITEAAVGLGRSLGEKFFESLGLVTAR